MRRTRAALVFGAATFALGFVCVWLYPGGAFDEFDFWSGTVALVIFAFGEVILFAWIFGMDRGWAEITRGADMRVPGVYRWIIRYVTPLFIGAVLAGAFLEPTGRWGEAVGRLFAGDGWPWASDSVIGRVLHAGDDDYRWFVDGVPTPDLVQDATRLLLLLVFLGCAGLVWYAWRRKRREAT